jgi:hypothetical protein
MGLHSLRTEPLSSLFVRGLGARLLAVVPDMTLGIVIFEAAYRCKTGFY